MLNIILAFVTGLTTGGLSCLAVQGGLLASSLAQQLEQSPVVSGAQAGKKKKARLAPARQALRGSKLAQPILAFLSAKLLAYTLLGFLLGLLGSMFQLSPVARAVFQIAIGIYMVGSALRMLNVHPIFRFFAFEPPVSLRRYLRRKSNEENGSSMAAPLFLGFLTVLIPCGITQAMMAAALATGNPIQGAALMFAFTLGTSPVFFAVAYFATQLGQRLEKQFMRFVAVVLLLLGLYTLDTGITLAGSPISFTLLASQATGGLNETVQAANDPPAGELQTFDPAGPDQEPPVVEDAAPSGDNMVTVNVKNGGYFPAVVELKAGEPGKLRLVSDEVYTCALSFMIPSLNVMKNLKPTDEVIIDIPAQQAGSTIRFSCSMGMYVGKIVFN